MSGTKTSSDPAEDLPYRIEVWQAHRPEEVERIVARAAGAQLARAIFQAAQDEHPGRRLTLSKGRRVLADTDGGSS